MNEREELEALRRLAALEAKAAGGEQSLGGPGAWKPPAPPPAPDPSEGEGTLQFGPWDTGIGIPQWANRGLAGLGKAVYDTGRGLGQLVGAVSSEDVREARRLDKPLMDTTAGFAGNLLGNVGMALSPGGVFKGAATVANALKAAPSTVGALSAAGGAMIAPQTIRGGAALGGAIGAVQPASDLADRATNIIGGGVAGGVVPAAITGFRALKSTAEPFYDAGQEAIVGRALNKAAGSDAPAVRRRLQEAAEPFVGPSRGTPRTVMGEFVPGSLPTVGQAAENPGVAALERAATATNPNVTNQVSNMLRTQNAARVGVLDDMAGSDGGRAFAEANRDATADQLYGAARAKGIDPAAMTPEAQANIAAFQQRMPDEVLAKARKLAKINGTPMDNSTALDGMHWTKKALDSLISEAKTRGDKDLARAYTKLQSDFVQGIDALSPDYAAARATFADMSRPINQMGVAGEIINKSVGKLDGSLKPSAYANALSDKTAARATGFSGATLENVLEPAQMNELNSILLDVRRATVAQNVGRGPGSDTVQKLAYTNLLDQSGVPSFMRSFAPTQVTGNLLGRVADAGYGRANRELSERLAQAMLDPAEAARLMERASPALRGKLSELLRVGSTAPLIALPGVVNAQKQ